MNMIDTLSPAECAAVFLMLLGDDEASSLLGRLQPGQLQLVGGAMCEIGDVEPAKVADAIASFIAEADNESLPSQDREVRVETLLSRAVGTVKSESLMQRIAPDRAPRSVEIARWLAPPILLSLVEGEHPQVIAVLLLLLEPDTAAQILASLPEDQQPQIVERIARLGQIPGEAIDMLDQLLTSRIEGRFGSSAMMIGGPKDAANLINLGDPVLGKRVLPEIQKQDEDLARSIEEEMFTFEMLLDLDPAGMGRLLRDVDNGHLTSALKGLPEEQRDVFFAAMSSRAADGVRDEIEMLPKLRRSDIAEAQKAVVDLARKLSEDGEISLGASDGEFI